MGRREQGQEWTHPCVRGGKASAAKWEQLLAKEATKDLSEKEAADLAYLRECVARGEAASRSGQVALLGP